MHKWKITLCTIILLYAYSLFFPLRHIPIITYFQPSEKFFFKSTTFYLHASDESLSWQMSSQTNEPAYLRQNIGLLYINGLFEDYYMDWKQETNQLQFQKKYPIDGLKKADSIGLHYGEFHHDGEIFSIQHMDTDGLYYINGQDPQKQKNEIDDQINKMYAKYIDAIYTHIEIDEDDYDTILLSNLSSYMNQKFLDLSLSQKEKLTGLLWESIYKKYVVDLLRLHNIDGHLMPTILFAKDRTHLYLVYQLDHEWSVYIQDITMDELE